MYSKFVLNMIIVAVFYILFFSCEKQKTPTKEDKNNEDLIGQTAFRYIATEPDWSPDGRKIAYTHHAYDRFERQQGDYQIWILDLETMQKSYLTPGRLPDWSPDGGKIAYNNGAHIFVIDLASKEITQLTDFTDADRNFFPSWSPDGKKIVYDSGGGPYYIWIMNADGSGKKDISVHGTGEWRMPDWSPDETRIVHIRYLPGGGPAPDIFVMDTTGNTPKRLTDDEYVEDYYPCWSRDGRKIAWLRIKRGFDPETGIWIMEADGSGKKQLTDFGEYPSWSADGSQIVYSSVLEKSGRIRNHVLWLVNADGTNKRPLLF